MPNPITQIGDEIREMTDDEYAAWSILEKEAADRKATIKAKEAARAAALAKLGLTADEITALFG